MTTQRMRGGRDWLPILIDAKRRNLAQFELANELGVHRAAVCQACKRFAVELRRGKPGRVRLITLDILRDAQKRGITAASLAREMGVTKAAISYACDNLGVRLTRYSESKPFVKRRLARLEAAFLKAWERGKGFNAFCIEARVSQKTVEKLEAKHGKILERWVCRHPKPQTEGRNT